MYFTYQPIYTSAHVPFDLKHRLEERQVQQLMLPLKVLAVIPLNDGIFKFTDSVGVAKYFEYAISDFSLLAIVAVGQHVIGSRLSQRWRKPLDGINIYHTLHIKQVDGYLDCIILAYLVYRLYIGSIY